MSLFEEPEGATPLANDEMDGLIPSWIQSRADLNAAEERNILQALAWTMRQRNRAYLTDPFIRTLHRRMFGEVWKWAGTLRRRETNIGVDPHHIPVAVAQLFGDVGYWLENATYEPDEIAVRLHHRLVAIHPFPNGNGRHTRLLADLVVQQSGRPPFSWGGTNLGSSGDVRTIYLQALRAADTHDIGPLLAFART